MNKLNPIAVWAAVLYQGEKVECRLEAFKLKL